MARSYGMVRQPPLFVVVGARHARDSSSNAAAVAAIAPQGPVAGMARSHTGEWTTGSASRQRAPELFQQDACVLR